jgi:hypothetical protein
MRGLVEEKEARAAWGEESCDIGCGGRVGVNMFQVPVAMMLALELMFGVRSEASHGSLSLAGFPRV